MAKEFKRSYKFALRTALYLTLFLTLFLSVFLYLFFQINYVLIVTFLVICFLLSFIITQYRVQNFIYKRVKKIYDDLTLLEAKSFVKQQITTDMATLTEEIDKYARDKILLEEIF